MHRCAVCGRPNAVALVLDSGRHLGWACLDQCGALLWAAAVLVQGGSEYDHALMTWMWRRRRCEVDGTACPPPPESPAEQALNAWIVEHGLEDIAKELE